jgi:tetratricopeptide (TPR) repeat protein
LVARLRSFALAKGENWQGGPFRLPEWETSPEGAAFRPVVPLWASPTFNSYGMPTSGAVRKPGRPPRPDEPSPEEMLEEMVSFAETFRPAPKRPEKVRVADARLADALRAPLADAGVVVENVERLPWFDDVRRSIQQTRGDLRVGLTAAKGVTLDRVRAFAEAAAAFYAAEPWKRLTSNDLMEVEGPEPAPFRFCTVLGSYGGERGVGSHSSREGFAHMASGGRPEFPLWGVTFDTFPETAFDDLDLWEREGLPLAGGDRIIGPTRYEESRRRRPSARELAFLEGLLRALADVTAAEVDAGTFRRRVRTFDGDAEYAFRLPDLLDPAGAPAAAGRHDPRDEMRAAIARALASDIFTTPEEAIAALNEKMVGRTPSEIRPPPRNDAERADDMVFSAMRLRGRARIKAVEQVLQFAPEHVRALRELAHEIPDVAKRIEHLERARASAERGIAPEDRREFAGRIGELDEGRLLIDVLGDLAAAYGKAGRWADCDAVYARLLEDDRDDRGGYRDVYVGRLLATGNDDGADALLKRYKDDDFSVHAYAKALLLFRRHGADSKRARAALQKARERNPFVDELLLRPVRPQAPPTYSPGQESEAAWVASCLGAAFDATPGAIDWLVDVPLDD